MKLPASTSSIYHPLKQAAQLLLHGITLSVDPSIGSSSSQPAWALYHAGKLMASGVGDIVSTTPTWRKCRQVQAMVWFLHRDHKPDVLVIEDIPPQRYMPKFGGNPHATGNSVKAHATLLKAVGATLAASNAEHVIEISPRIWKPRARANYQKSDVNDAIELGWVTIQLAQLMVEKYSVNGRRRKLNNG